MLLHKRVLIEATNDQWQNISQIEQTRHRGVTRCMVDPAGGFVAYGFQPKKPSLRLRYDPRLPVYVT